jgi:predicted nucleic-acid-binding protein
LIELDTNVLVRYLAQDDAWQSALATRLIEKTLSPSNRGFVGLITLIETMWVMESCYGADAATVAGILDDLVDASSLQLQ